MSAGASPVARTPGVDATQMVPRADRDPAQCGGMFCGSQMPLGGSFLAQSVPDAIRTWITNEAMNDCP